MLKMGNMLRVARVTRGVATVRVAPVVRARGLATKVLTCTDAADFEKAKSSDSGAVVYFTATWCGPCRMISPIFAELAEGASAETTFLKVDVDDQADVAADAQIAAMPTFQFYKGGKLLDQLVGADPEKLKTYVGAHLS